MNTCTGIWVQLYIDRQKIGNAFEIEPIPEHVYALKKATMEENLNRLKLYDACELLIYPPGTDFPIQEGVEPFNADEPLSEIRTTVTTKNGEEGPLIVVAPSLQSLYRG